MPTSDEQPTKRINRILRALRPSTLSWYIIKEQVPPMLVGTLFFTFVLIVNKIIVLLSLLIEKDVPARYSLELFLLMFPFTLALTVPIAILMGTVMAMGRLSSDSEIIAMRASGISYYSIYRSLFLMGIVYTFFMLIFNNYVLPFANTRYRVLYDTISQSQPVSLIEEGVFNVIPGDEQTIYARKVDRKKKQLHDIIIYQENKKSQQRDIIVAQTGKWLERKDQTVSGGYKTLRLFRGRVHLGNRENHTYSIIDFSSDFMDINLFEDGGLMARQDTEQKSEKEKSLEEIYFDLQQYTQEQVQPYSLAVKKEIAYRELEFWKHITIPLACMALTLIGLPLGIVSHRSGRGMGFGLAVISSFIYYILLMAGERAARALSVPAWVGAWQPVIVVSIIGVLLIYFRNSAENFMEALFAISKATLNIKNKLFKFALPRSRQP